MKCPHDMARLLMVYRFAVRLHPDGQLNVDYEGLKRQHGHEARRLGKMFRSKRSRSDLENAIEVGGDLVKNAKELVKKESKGGKNKSKIAALKHELDEVKSLVDKLKKAMKGEKKEKKGDEGAHKQQKAIEWHPEWHHNHGQKSQVAPPALTTPPPPPAPAPTPVPSTPSPPAPPAHAPMHPIGGQGGNFAASECDVKDRNCMATMGFRGSRGGGGDRDNTRQGLGLFGF